MNDKPKAYYDGAYWVDACVWALWQLKVISEKAYDTFGNHKLNFHLVDLYARPEKWQNKD